MPEPTGGLGAPLVRRPTGILSSNVCPGNSNIPEYAYHMLKFSIHKVIKKIMKYIWKIRM